MQRSIDGNKITFRKGDLLEREQVPEWLRSFLFRSFTYDAGTDIFGYQVYKKATVLESRFYHLFYEEDNSIRTVRDVSFELSGHTILCDLQENNVS